MKTDECVTSIIKQLTDDIRKKIKKGEDLLKKRYKVIALMKDESVTHKKYVGLEREKEILDEEINDYLSNVHEKILEKAIQKLEENNINVL